MTRAAAGTETVSGDASGVASVSEIGIDGDSGVRVWTWVIAPQIDDADVALLDDTEQARLAGMRSSAKAAEFVGSRAAVRRILGSLLDTAPDRVCLERRPCPRCGSSRHGPPTIAHPSTELWISLSHTGGRGALAVAHTPLGIDVERMRGLAVDELAPVSLTAAESTHLASLPEGEGRERSFLRSWTRKEAVLKAVGIGLATDLSTLESHLDSPRSATIRFGVPGTPDAWSVTDVGVPEPWVCSLAVPAE